MNKRERRIASWQKYSRYTKQMILTHGRTHLTDEERGALSCQLTQRHYIYETCVVGRRYYERRNWLLALRKLPSSVITSKRPNKAAIRAVCHAVLAETDAAIAKEQRIERRIEEYLK